MYSRRAAGMPVISASVFSGNCVGRPMPSQRQRPASVRAYKIQAAGGDGCDIGAGQGLAGQAPTRMDRGRRSGKADQRAGRIAA